MNRLVLTAALYVCVAASLHGAVLYDFLNFSKAATGVPVGASATDFDLTTGAGALGSQCSATGNPDFSCGLFGGAGASGSTFTTFTVSANPGNALNLISFSFDERNAAGFGPNNFDVYTGVDGFTTPILSGALSQSAALFSNHSVSLAGAPFQGLSTIVFRISGYGGSSNPQSGWQLDNVTLDLTVSQTTPEPASGALVSLACALAWFGRKKLVRP